MRTQEKQSNPCRIRLALHSILDTDQVLMSTKREPSLA